MSVLERGREGGGEWSWINELSFHLDSIEIEEQIKCELRGGEKIKIMAELNRAEKHKAEEN